MKIPLHSLVFDFTNSLSGVEGYEFLSIDKIRRDLIGKDEGYYLNIDFLNELKSRINNKLWVGERVIVSSKGMKKFERDFLSHTASDLGLQIFYIVDKDYSDSEVLRGDGRAEVCNINTTTIIKKINNKNLLNVFPDEYRGITVVGDVHGQMEALMSAIYWAKKRNNLLIFLGDIIDFGVKSLDCIEEIYKLVIRNQAIFIFGNHERKIFKWLNKYTNRNIKIHLSEANKQTIEKIKSLSSQEKRKWESKYRALMNLGFTHLNIEDKLFFVHASFSNEMLCYSDKRILPSELERLALFGEIKSNPNWEDDNSHNLTYLWINSIPKGMTVFVGHEPRSNFKPYYEINKEGGSVYFIDTGCGKGGNLTTADIVLSNEGNTIEYVVQNFNHW